MPQLLPDENVMYKALLDKDSRFEGIFFVAVKTTGIFCRPTCTAKKPFRKNIEFFPSTKEALLHGYRPCKTCRPLGQKGEYPSWLKPLMEKIKDRPDIRLRDRDLKAMGVDPHRVRRWFKRFHGMTFQAYLRTLRITQAFGRIKYGEKVIVAAFDSGYESLSGFVDTFKKTTGFSPSQSHSKQIVRITRILTPLGPMLAGASDKGLCLLEFVDRRMLETQIKRLERLLKADFLPGTENFFEDLANQLREYFEKKRTKFTVPLDIRGTPFQKQAWSALQKIPYGQTRSYAEQARAVGRPAAVRAVARANGDNRISVIIPCHRVIGSDGKLVGYGGGLWRKQYLLDLESPK